MKDQKKNQSIGGLYSRTSKSNLKYLDGFINLNGKSYKILVFKNTGEKKSDTTPDYSIIEKAEFKTEGRENTYNKPSYQKPAPKAPVRKQSVPVDEPVEPDNAEDADQEIF